MTVNLLQLTSINTSNYVHIFFTLIDPIYGFVGTYNRISNVRIMLIYKISFNFYIYIYIYLIKTVF